jgi:hypothetical protein
MLEIVVLIIHRFQLIYCIYRSVKTYPLESWLAAVLGMAFFNQTNGLEDVCYIIQPSNFGF